MITKPPIQLLKLIKLMKRYCGSCETHVGIKLDQRCCDSAFCSITTKNLENLGIKDIYKEKATHKSVTYLGEKGCVVPSEYRPFCSMFACPVLLDIRSFRREYERLSLKIEKSPYLEKASKELPPLESVAKELLCQSH